MALRSRWCGRILSDVIGRPRPGEAAILAPVLEDEPCHEARHRPTRLLGKHPPQRRIRGGARWAEQIALSGLTLKAARNGCAGVAWASLRFWSQLSLAAPENGACDDGRPPASPLSDRHQQGAKRQQCRQIHAGSGCQPHRQAGQPVEHPGRQFLPAGRRSRHERSAPRPRQTSRSPHEHGRHIQPKGAKDKRPPAPQHARSCGRSVARLYNHERPHLGYRNQGRRPWETVERFVRQGG